MYVVESGTEVIASLPGIVSGIANSLHLAQREPANQDDPRSPLSSYYELRDRIVRARNAGLFEEAFRLCDDAMRLAKRLEDEDLVEQAYCNRSVIAMTLGCGDEPFAGLREILMRNRSERTSFLAAYNLAYGYTRKREYKKALFYARVSRDRALATRNDEWISSTHNEIGNCLLSESYFEEAVAEYERALVLLPKRFSARHVASLGNLGYCKILQGDLESGCRSLFTCLRWCRRNPSENVYEMLVHLFLCSGFIEMERWRYAWLHGSRGLELAEATGDCDAIKNGLYLMGEVEKSGGDLKAAYSYYSRLQREFYPEKSNLPDMMLSIDTKQLVNLRA